MSTETVMKPCEVSDTAVGHLGVDPAAVERAASTAGPVVLVGVPGCGAPAVARAIHQRAGRQAFHQVDGSLADAEARLSDVLQRAGHSDTVFVGDVVDLDGDARERLVRAARDGNSPSIILAGDADDILVRQIGSVSVEIRPLHQRRDVIPSLVNAQLARFKQAPCFTDDAFKVMKSWEWPGDVRELELVVDRLLLGCTSPVITGGDVGRALSAPTSFAEIIKKPIADVEREHILRVLDSQSWNRTRSARILGIDVKTLYNKLKRYESESDAQL